MSSDEEDGFSTPPPAVSAKRSRPDVGEELSKLKFRKQNQSMAKVPPTLAVERRPLTHAPIASPFSGAGVQKVVYVSRNTPIMAAVKRVKKLLLHVEKRVLQGVDLTKDRSGMRKLAEANEKLGKAGEEVLVKASGRAMEQALRVGEWFRNREEELACKVKVRTGSVQAVDDIVEIEWDDTVSEGQPGEHKAADSLRDTYDTSLVSTSGGHENSISDDSTELGSNEKASSSAAKAEITEQENRPQKRRRRGKRKEEVLDLDTTARIRWVKTVEVAISLKT
jgi:ribonuclease P/MRP protein subunit POP7